MIIKLLKKFKLPIYVLGIIGLTIINVIYQEATMTMQNDLDYDELYENLKEELGREPNEDEINERFENSSNQVLTIFDNL